MGQNKLKCRVSGLVNPNESFPVTDVRRELILSLLILRAGEPSNGAASIFHFSSFPFFFFGLRLLYHFH